MASYDFAAFESDDLKIVQIISVNPNNLTAIAANADRMIEVQLNRSPAGILIIPNEGERWIIQRTWTNWVLSHRTEWQNPLFLDNPDVGETRIGASTVLTLQANSMNFKTNTANERSATLATGITGGFVKYQIAPSGHIYCWGEVSFAAYSGAQVVKNIATLSNSIDPEIQVIPSTRRLFNGTTGPSLTQSVLIQMGTSGTLSFWTTPSVNQTDLYFSTSWYVDPS
jgi:hypothetical protein